MTRTSPLFQLRGVVEGFYGVYYTFPERNDLIRFIGAHGFNFYLYGPKNDRQHRMRWWDPYPAAIMSQFARTIEVARESGVTFCYAISFGTPINHASPDDFRTVTDKLQGFYDRGVRAFAVFLDDIGPGFQHDVNSANRDRYQDLAEAHAEICNRLYAWLQERDPACTLFLCQSEYHGRAPFSSYLSELGRQLHPAVTLFYSGPDICSSALTVADVEDFTAASGRVPLLWDNYPVNDLDMRGEMHIGPIRGRDPELYRAVAGVFVNPMNQPEASRIPLLTYADYLRDPHGYDPELSWQRALAEVAGTERAADLCRLAENSLRSCLGTPEAPVLDRLAQDAVAALRAGARVDESAAVGALDAYVNGLDESCYALKNRMENLALRHDLLPWIEALEDWAWLGKRALLALRAMEAGTGDEVSVRVLRRSLDDLLRGTRRIAGNALVPLAEYVFERAGIAGDVSASPNRTLNEAFITPDEQEVTAG